MSQKRKGNEMNIKIPLAILALIAGSGFELVRASEPNTNGVSVVVNVPGNANPWLAGMPDGAIAGNNHDVAPDQSPIQIQNVPAAGAVFTFSAVGGVGNDPGQQLRPADGYATWILSRIPGAENGIADLTAPIDALVGVFLDDNEPAGSTAPASLDFGSTTNRDFVTLSPVLRQPFYIGSGKTSAGVVQEFNAPPGATRLFLGVMDGQCWSDNKGSFTVTVNVRQSSAKP
jgi:hypothetical protein